MSAQLKKIAKDKSGKIRVAIYVRVSTLEQAKEGYSIKEQIKRLKKYCEAMGWIVVKTYVDAGASGANLERPAMQELISEVDMFDKVVTWKLDRLSRSQKDTLNLIEDIFLPNDVDYTSMTENFDTSTSFGRAMLGILSVFAQLERERISERMQMGLQARAEEGKFHGSAFTPIGYDYIDGKLKVNDYEAMQIQEIYKMFLAHTPIYSIERIMSEKGYKHQHGIWKDKTIRRILKTKTILGYTYYKGEWYDGEHDPIIDKETWNKAQDLLNSRNNNIPFSHNSYLSGFLYCKHCTAKYFKYNGTPLKDGTQRPKYGCYSRAKTKHKYVIDPSCKNKIWNMHELDDKVFNEIRKLVLNPEVIEEMKENHIPDDNSERIKILSKKLKELDEQSDRLIDLYTLGKIDSKKIEVRTEAINKEKYKLQSELNSIVVEDVISNEEAIEIASSLDEALNNSNMSEVRYIIGELIDKIIIDEDKITIHWKFV